MLKKNQVQALLATEYIDMEIWKTDIRKEAAIIGLM